MTRKKVPYKTGDWFAVPLRTGGFAVGIIANANRRAGILFGYFFGPKRRALPRLDELRALTPKDAVLLAQFGDLGLIKGEWPIVGSVDAGEQDWPMPPLVRRDAMTGRPQLVTYRVDDPTLEADVRGCRDDECEGLPEDGVYGYGAVETKLTNVL